MKKFKKQSIVIAASMNVVFIAASAAHASVIAFENPPGPGHFDWNANSGHNYLSITAPSASQPGIAGAEATFRRRNVSSVNAAEIRGATNSSLVQTVQLGVGPTFGSVIFLSPMDWGSIIPSPVGPQNDGFYVAGVAYFGASDPGYPTSTYDEAVEQFVGVQFSLGSDIHYGWIGIVRSGAEVDAFAWGYETEPGVPIAAGAGIPEPASLSLLMIGALGIVGRRRIQ